MYRILMTNYSRLIDIELMRGVVSPEPSVDLSVSAPHSVIIVKSCEKFGITMKLNLSSTVSSKLLYYFAKLIGLAPFVLANNRFRPPTARDLFYSTVLALAHLLGLAIAVVLAALEFEERPLARSVKIWSATQYLACLPATFSVLVAITLSHKTIVRLMNQLTEMNDKLEALGLDEDPRKFFKHVIARTAVANSAVVVLCVSGHLLEHRWHPFRTIEYAIGCLFNINWLLIHGQVLACIGRRFEMLNEMLSEEVNSRRSPRLVREAEGLHSKLCELLGATNDVFSAPILLTSFQFLCIIVLSGQWMYSFVQLPNPSCNGSRLLVFDTNAAMIYLLRMANVTGEIIMIAHTSAAICRQGNATRATIVRMWNESKSAELQDELFMFSIQLAETPVSVSVFGILDLDYSYVYKIFGSAITYVFVIVQFTTEDTNPYSWETLQARNACTTL